MRPITLFVAVFVAVCAQAQSTLPRLGFELTGGPIVDEPKVEAYLRLETAAGVDYEGWVGIEIRGRSSQLFAKKGYGFETREADGENRDVSLLGMPAENDWVLHGPYADKTYLRNALAYTTARAIGAPAPRSRFCEVFFDGAYQGIYLLVEKVKRDAARVPMDELSADGSAGDFMVEAAGYRHATGQPDPSGEGYTSVHAHYPEPGARVYPGFSYAYPKPRDLEPDQATAIRTWMEDLTAESYAPPGSPTFERFVAGVDWASFTDYIIAQEFTKNVDAYLLSTYYVRRGGARGKLYAGPVWDFNFAFGNADYLPGHNVGDLQVLTEGDTLVRVAPPLFSNLYRAPAFRQNLQRRWRELRAGPLADEAVAERIDSLLAEVLPHFARDTAVYGISGRYTWPNTYVGEDFLADVVYLRDWVAARLAYLDDLWGPAATAPPTAPSRSRLRANPTTVGGGWAIVTPDYADDYRAYRLYDARGVVVASGRLAPGVRRHRLPAPAFTGLYVAELTRVDGGVDRLPLLCR